MNLSVLCMAVSSVCTQAHGVFPKIRAAAAVELLNLAGKIVPRDTWEYPGAWVNLLLLVITLRTMVPAQQIFSLGVVIKWS